MDEGERIMEKMFLENVYTTSGVPTVTYVQPKEYLTLVVALRTPGKCVVVEGPSGIGKTTAVNKILAELNLTCTVLSARKPSDFPQIQKVGQDDFEGIVIIDDFHRLESKLQEDISNVMKYLADEGAENKKIVVIGINKVGNALIRFSPDLNNRISTIRFESNSDNKMLELIEKGEKALNIEFDNKQDIVSNAYGSFHIVQIMCQKACIENEIIQTCDTHTQIHFSYPKIQAVMSEEFARHYYEIARTFATGNRLRREGRAPYLHVLKWLTESDTWSLALLPAIQKHPAQKAGVTQIVEKGFLRDFIEEREELAQYLHFDANTRTISAEDPKLIFYLRTLNWNNFAKDIGYLQLVSAPKYDYALSFAGANRNIAKKIFDRLTSLEINVFYDHNEQAEILSQNVEEYLFPIYNSEAAYVVPLLSKEYPTRVWTKIESKAFKERFGQNAVIPVWFSDANAMFDESKDYGGYQIDVEQDLDAQIDELTDLLVKKISEYRLKATM